MILRNTDYSIGILHRMPDVYSCFETDMGFLRFETTRHVITFLKELAPNHWVRIDCDFSKGFDKERFSC